MCEIISWIQQNQDWLSLGIEIVGMFASIGAVFAAIRANRTATKTLEQSLSMHEQTKNVDLFDKRVSLIDEIASIGKTSEMHLKMLFTESILQKYREYLICLNKANAIEADLRIYIDRMSEIDGDGDYSSPIAELQDAEQMLEKSDYPSDKVEKYELLCQKYQATGVELGKPEDTRIYNYALLTQELSSLTKMYISQQEELQQLMQDYVSESIQLKDNHETT